MYALLLVARFIHFASCLLLLAVFAIRPPDERPEAGCGARRFACGFLAAALASGFLWFWAAAAGMSGSGLADALNPQLLGMVLWQTPPGHVWALRCAVGVTLGVLLFRGSGAWRRRAGMALAAMFTGSLAWLEHAGAGEDGRRAWMLGADVTHLLAAAFWPAGLLPFGLLLRQLLNAGALREAREAVRRFSATSLAAVALLAASGVVNSFFLAGSFHALIASDYGRLLTLKITFFAIAVGLGACNLLVHKPLIDTAPEALAAMRSKVWAELGLGMLIVIVVAIMGTLPPSLSPAQ